MQDLAGFCAPVLARERLEFLSVHAFHRPHSLPKEQWLRTREASAAGAIGGRSAPFVEQGRAPGILV